MDTQTKNTTTEFLMQLYKNMKMGADSIINVSSNVGEGEFREELIRELDSYEKFSNRIGELIYDEGDTPKEEGFFSKLGAKMGMAMKTMTDSTTSHIAQMMIEGATMGITENTKLIHEYGNKGVSDEAMTLARDTVKYMEETVETLKKYL